MNLAMKTSLFVEVLVCLDSPGLILTLIPPLQTAEMRKKATPFSFKSFSPSTFPTKLCSLLRRDEEMDVEGERLPLVRPALFHVSVRNRGI